MRRAILARFEPSAASSASCVGRTRIIANSAATKNPFAMMKSNASSRYQVGILSGSAREALRNVARIPWWRAIVAKAGGNGVREVRKRDEVLSAQQHLTDRIVRPPRLASVTRHRSRSPHYLVKS